MTSRHRSNLLGLLVNVVGGVPFLIAVLLSTSCLNADDKAAARALASSNGGMPGSSLRRSLLANKKVCISGGGPCGLFLAALLIQREPTVQITVLEKTQRCGKNINAFGIGLGSRLLRSLEAVPGLRNRVETVGAPSNMGTAIVSRADLSEQITRFLEDSVVENERCQIRFGEGCAGVNFDARKLTTTAGRTIKYDVLIGADGINSIVRRTLVKERGLQEEHYLEPVRWKALQLPPQPDVESGSFKPLQHKSLRAGRVLPRYPEGHILLLFWDPNSGADNPGGVTTARELKALLTDAMQDHAPNERGRNYRTLGGGGNNETIGERRNILFDDEAVNVFLRTRSSRSHYMKIDRFHDDSVALVGDSAAGMNSLLGQGCACGLKNAEVLAECLLDSASTDLNEALQCYSYRAIPGAHAITDLNLVAALRRNGPLVNALVILLTLPQKLRGKLLFQRISDPDVPYEQILRENSLLIALARRRWKRDREPLDRR